MTPERLPGVPLLMWCRERPEIPDEMRWKQAHWSQVLFVRDRLPMAWARTDAEYSRHDADGTLVVGTHRSKSIELPVYQIDLPQLGVVAMLRGNFYNWKVSIRAEADVALNPDGLFDPADERSIRGVYCGGFAASWVFGPYAKDRRRFTLEASNEHQVYTLFHLLARGQAR